MLCNHYIALSYTAKGKDGIHYSEQTGRLQGQKGKRVVNTFLAMFPCNLFPNPLPQACRENAFDKLLCSQSQKGGRGPGLVYGEPHVILALSQTRRMILCGYIFPNYYCCHLHDNINHS